MINDHRPIGWCGFQLSIGHLSMILGDPDGAHDHISCKIQTSYKFPTMEIRNAEEEEEGTVTIYQSSDCAIKIHNA